MTKFGMVTNLWKRHVLHGQSCPCHFRRGSPAPPNFLKTRTQNNQICVEIMYINEKKVFTSGPSCNTVWWTTCWWNSRLERYEFSCLTYITLEGAKVISQQYLTVIEIISKHTTFIVLRQSPLSVISPYYSVGKEAWRMSMPLFIIIISHCTVRMQYISEPSAAATLVQGGKFEHV